jgi:glycosyltransferase involved in cell wall biosynthesis
VAVRKVLVLSGLQVFPPESGGQLRTAGLIGALVSRGFDVTVYSMVGRKRDYLSGKPSGTTQIREHLREYVDRGRLWAALQFLAYRLSLPPFWITWLLRLHKPRELRQLIASSDAVIVDFPFLYPAGRKAGRPVALNTHNVEAALWKSAWVRHLVATIERRAARNVQHVFCCAEGDRAFFASVQSGAPTSLVPNGIDPERFRDLAAARAPLRASLGYTDGDRVLLFAASSFGPNVEALTWLEGFVAANQDLLARRNLHFLVVGSVSKQPYERARLKVVGMVDRVEPYFAAADLGFNCVLRGSGTNLKMAEFIAAGLPIISSVSGMRGYDLLEGEDCIAFTPDTLTAALSEHSLPDDPGKLSAMAKRAYEKNKRQIDMNWCVEPLAAWLEEAR